MRIFFLSSWVIGTGSHSEATTQSNDAGFPIEAALISRINVSFLMCSGTSTAVKVLKSMKNPCHPNPSPYTAVGDRIQSAGIIVEFVIFALSEKVNGILGSRGIRQEPKRGAEVIDAGRKARIGICGNLSVHLDLKMEDPTDVAD